MTSILFAHRAFLSDILSRQDERRKLVDPVHDYPPAPRLFLPPILTDDAEPTLNLPSTAVTVASKVNIVNYVPEEETIRNDYADWYGVSGVLGSNHILGAGDDEICEEYPALRRLMNLKKEQITQTSHPAIYHHLSNPSPATIATTLSPTKFDVILINRIGSWESTLLLPIRHISADPGFVFLWVGRGDQMGLERGRECLARWGFRRAEDIVWVKTNRGNARSSCSGDGDGAEKDGRHGSGTGIGGLFGSQKEHCLMGIRGTVRRSTDSRFVHCNVDTDVMIWEDDGESESRTKHPPYLYTLIENFCLGTRRLELFGSPNMARRGWVTAGLSPLSPSLSPGLASSPPTSSEKIKPYDPATYTESYTKDEGKAILPYQAEIDALRPKSPQRRNNRPLLGSSLSSSSSSGYQQQNQQQQQSFQNQSRPPHGTQGFRPPSSSSSFRPTGMGPRHYQPGNMYQVRPGSSAQRMSGNQMNPMVHAFQPQPQLQPQLPFRQPQAYAQAHTQTQPQLNQPEMGYMEMMNQGMMDPNMMLAMNMAMMNMPMSIPMSMGMGMPTPLMGAGMGMGMGGMGTGMGMNQNYMTDLNYNNIQQPSMFQNQPYASGPMQSYQTQPQPELFQQQRYQGGYMGQPNQQQHQQQPRGYADQPGGIQGASFQGQGGPFSPSGGPSTGPGSDPDWQAGWQAE